MAEMKVMSLPIWKVQLDKENPRIAAYIEQYGENISAEAVAFALDDTGSSGTSFAALRDAIKSNGGLIQPIIVNHTAEDLYVVIEGNTRLKIYQEFEEQGVKGNWSQIPAIVYENMSPLEINTTRLQAHMVGPREWSRYAKAKYLHSLSCGACMTMSQIVDSCGGKKSEIDRMIKAYTDMEKHYRPQLDSDDQFDPRTFSHFEEMEKRTFLETLHSFGFSKDDFAKWVIDGKIPRAQSVRDISEILHTEKARELFLSAGGDTDEAIKMVHKVEVNTDSDILKQVETINLIKELSDRITSIPYQRVKQLASNPDSSVVRQMDFLCNSLSELLQDIIPEQDEDE